MGSTDLFGEWRLADQAAMAATQCTVEKSIIALEGLGDPPTEEETGVVKRLRLIADAHFMLAMARMNAHFKAAARR